MSDDLRELLDKAMGPEDTPAPPAADPPAEEKEEKDAAPLPPAAEKAEKTEKAEKQEPAPGVDAAPAPEPGAPNVPPAASSAPQPAAQPAAALRPPASMRPEARAQWDKVPLEVQAEVHRRDREVNDALRSSAEARRFHEEFRQTVAPYESMIRSEGSEPIKAVENLFKTAAALRTASAPVKARMVAEIVRDFGIDVVMLDSALSGTLPPPAPPPPYVQQLQQELEPLREFVSQFRQQRETVQARTQAEAAAEIEEFFADEEANPYVNDLREEIADILEVAARRGVQMSLRDAYSRATMLHPTISKLVENRGVAQTVAQQNAAAQRARNAAASVKSAPTGSSGDEDDADDSIRGALNKSIAKISGKV